jgi:hypothetical protein
MTLTRRQKKVRKGGKSRCFYCRRMLEASTSPGKLAYTADHVTPQSLGGTKTVPCCRQCNGLKGSIHPKEWFWFIGKYTLYWRDFRTNTEVIRAIVQERKRRATLGEEVIVPALMGSAEHGLDSFGKFNG